MREKNGAGEAHLLEGEKEKHYISHLKYSSHLPSFFIKSATWSEKKPPAKA